MKQTEIPGEKTLITWITLKESQKIAQEILETIVIPQNEEYERRKKVWTLKNN